MVRELGLERRVVAVEIVGVSDDPEVEPVPERIGDDPRDRIDAKLEFAQMLKAMKQLPQDQREAVALVLIEGVGYREAAAILNIPAGTLSSRLVRGRNALLALVGEG